MNEAKRNYKKKVERHYVELYQTDDDIKGLLLACKVNGLPFATLVKHLLRYDADHIYAAINKGVKK